MTRCSLRHVAFAAALTLFAVLSPAGVAQAQARDPAIQVPPEILARKKLSIALFAAFPPMAYKVPETDELVGIDVDLANYVGRKLGVSVAWQDTSYESAINSLNTGRVDMAFSMLDAPEAADRLDYVPYLSTGMLPYTLATHAPIATALDICGLKVGANRRNGFGAAMRQWSDSHCLSAGRPAVQVQESDGTSAARLALRQGRVDVAVQSSESVPFTMALEKGVYVTIGTPLTRQFIVAAFPKGSQALRVAVTQALKAAVADGTYAAALARHGLAGNSAASQLSSR